MPGMRNRAVFVVALGLLAAACGSGSATGETQATSVPATTATPTTTTAAPPTSAEAGEADPTTTSTTTTAAPAVVVDGPPAPDFTLALEDPAGETFTLSEESKPVYMVFWAEW